MKVVDKALIELYRSAYVAANGETCPYKITFVYGWFQFWYPGHLVKYKSVRRTQLQEMTKRLERKAKSDKVSCET